MIQANELRIGNWVNMTCDNASFDTRIDVGDFMDISRGYKVVEPIPLTEEWLLKFGFVKDGKNGYLVKNMGVIKVHKHFYYGNRVKIAHVHQLQNLYFALTGKELV